MLEHTALAHYSLCHSGYSYRKLNQRGKQNITKKKIGKNDEEEVKEIKKKKRRKSLKQQTVTHRLLMVYAQSQIHPH